MSKFIIIFSILFLNAFANPTILQKQNVLYVQKLIENEEAIAKAFEKYLLNEFKIPTIKDLLDNKYLGSNFSLENIMGENLKEDYKIDKKLPYAITKEIYQNSDNSYIKALYNRDLYRDRTYVVDDDENYINIEFKSEEAKNVFNILENGDEIKKDCKNPEKDKFCSDYKYLRYYTTSTNYIQFTKELYLKGSISTNYTLSDKDLDIFIDGGKFEDLLIGSNIFDKIPIQHKKFSNTKIIEVK